MCICISCLYDFSVTDILFQSVINVPTDVRRNGLLMVSKRVSLIVMSTLLAVGKGICVLWTLETLIVEVLRLTVRPKWVSPVVGWTLEVT